MPDCDQLSGGLMTVRETAEFLSVGRSFVYQEMARGVLAWVKLGRSRRVPRRAVLEYVATRLATTTDERDARPTADSVGAQCPE